MVYRKIRLKMRLGCYFDKGSLQVIDVKDLNFTTCPLRLIYIFFMKAGV